MYTNKLITKLALELFMLYRAGCHHALIMELRTCTTTYCQPLSVFCTVVPDQTSAVYMSSSVSSLMSMPME